MQVRIFNGCRLFVVVKGKGTLPKGFAINGTIKNVVSKYNTRKESVFNDHWKNLFWVNLQIGL